MSRFFIKARSLFFASSEVLNPWVVIKKSPEALLSPPPQYYMVGHSMGGVGVYKNGSKMLRIPSLVVGPL